MKKFLSFGKKIEIPAEFAEIPTEFAKSAKCPAGIPKNPLRVAAEIPKIHDQNTIRKNFS